MIIIIVDSGICSTADERSYKSVNNNDCVSLHYIIYCIIGYALPCILYNPLYHILRHLLHHQLHHQLHH